jgi:hypothetical protein
MAGNEHDVDSQRVLELVRDIDCSAHVCEFIRPDAKLVTTDSKLPRAFPKHTVALAG